MQGKRRAIGRLPAACVAGLLIAFSGSHCAPPVAPASTPGTRTASGASAGDPDFVAAMTRALQLDDAQKQKARELVQQLEERYSKIRENWDRTGKVRVEPLLVSQATFERDFVAILTDAQQKAYAEMKQKLLGARTRLR